MVHPRILREAASILSVPLSIIFRATLETGQIPEDWKCANISAIHKKGDKSRCENYRPVSLTSIVCKTLERIIRKTMMDHMKRHHLFSTQQYGFINSRSTTLQLLNVLDMWTEALDQGDSVDVIYCDFKKAFDKVPHRRLLRKVRAYGFKGRILDWVTGFLTGRRQRVRVRGTHSEWSPVVSGIPQGSVLGPLLFVLYVNDLPQITDASKIFLFADDLKIFQSIRTDEDKRRLQGDLNKICVWTEKWLLELHPDKCVSMSIGNQTPNDSSYSLSNGHLLKKVAEEKDIGVIIDSNLTFESHMSSKISKANRILGLIWRVFEYKDPDTMIKLYKALVRPHLEYANQVWSPHLKKTIEAIENVQRRVTRMIPGLKNMSYEERLHKLKLPTLAYRRLRGDMVELYKMTSGMYDESLLQGHLRLRTNSTTRGHDKKVYVSQARLNVRRSSFYIRTAEIWNKLPDDVVNAPSLPAFESRLDRTWANHPLKFDHKADQRANPATVAQSMCQ
jgi:hypothetical protein